MSVTGNFHCRNGEELTATTMQHSEDRWSVSIADAKAGWELTIFGLTASRAWAIQTAVEGERND